MVTLLSWHCCGRIALPYLSLDIFQSWSKQPGFSDSWYHLTIWFRFGDHPVEHHLRERIAPRKIESRRTPQIELSLHAADSTFDAGFEFSIIHYQFSLFPPHACPKIPPSRRAVRALP
jgi:hypothetical protein